MPSIRVVALALAGATGLALLAPSTAQAVPSAGGAHSFQDHQQARGHRLGGHGAGALRALAAASAAVTRVAEQEQASGLLSAADKASAATFNAAALAALSADSDAVSRATPATSVKDVVRSAKRTVEGVRTVRQVLTASARMSARAGVLTTSAAGVGAAADAAVLTDLAARVGAAQAALTTADAAALAIPAAPTSADLRSARRAAHTALKAAHVALGAAAADLELLRGEHEAATASRTS